jgi:hypothetical protein
MNRIPTLRHLATELFGCTEDTVSLEDAQTTLEYSQKVESGEMPLIADEVAIYEKRILSLLNLTNLRK